MVPEVAKAQAQALDEWAVAWDGETAEGASELPFLMRRAARQIRRAMGFPEVDGSVKAEVETVALETKPADTVEEPRLDDQQVGGGNPGP